ncbi:hypothetical protein ZIOFF_066415 [Zingiber officinale]|uniref:UDP-glucuronate decarboxylase n=1 Tax=Zingiber officinale TaxID=94328 RepID=A0A8J5F307_ZINOF|nr:hypothetical protein ZIOFF_066415 [Zingiber officinale]
MKIACSSLRWGKERVREVGVRELVNERNLGFFSASIGLLMIHDMGVGQGIGKGLAVYAYAASVDLGYFSSSTFFNRVFGFGLLGTHLMDYLITRADNVIVVDNIFMGRKENVLHHLGNPNFEIIRPDLVHPLLLEVDQIYHLACPGLPACLGEMPTSSFNYMQEESIEQKEEQMMIPVTCVMP